MQNRYLFFLGLLIASLVLATGAILGQTTGGTILGTVKDQSGAVLPGAGVVIKNLETGAAREVLTNDAGRYSAPQLALGTYEAEASLPGFQTEVRTGIKLTVGRQALVDFVLALGEISEKIQVTGDAPVVETTSSTIAGLVDDQKIRDLPLNGRSFSDLVTLQMGAVTQTLGARNSASGFGLKISVAGARPSENSFLLDGNFVNDTLNNTPAGATGRFLGVETLREFTVLTNTFSAEYGQSAGAIVNAVTKSGTNELHGSLFYFHRNSALDARNFFDQDEVPPFRRHQFGGVLGGPIVRNRTFFFGGYEGLREGLGTTNIIDTLTAEARQGILPGRAPIRVAPGISDYFILFPLPNGRPKSPGAAEYLFTRTQVSRQDNVVAKVDHNFSDADSIFVRYTFDDANLDRPGVNYASLFETRSQYVTVEEKKVFSSGLLNVFRFGYSRSVLSDNDRPMIDLPPKLQLVPLDRNAIPEVAKGQLGNFGVSGTGGGRLLGIGNSSVVPRLYHFNLFEYSDTVSYLKGAHSLKFGADIKRVQPNLVSPQRLFGTITFTSITNFLQGNASIFQFVRPGSDVIRGIRFTAMGFFVQDDIRVRPNFTLNLGLRYEPSTEHTEVNGKIASLRDPRNDTELTVGKLFENPTLKNFAPRIGLAWDPWGNGRTSIRAGFGVFYNIQMAELDRISATSNPPFTTVLAFQNFKFPFNFDDVVSGALAPRPALESIDFRPGQPYRMQYNLNIQRELFPNTSLTVGYVGARGVDL
ncbi:MAG: TonB-dependent receptor, partial [Acidobacteria bacterium]|nr:TonB-dependent receptor [Acidobacteriota bacterium]